MTPESPQGARPSRQELLAEYAESGHFERQHAQLAFNSMTVFLAATGGALTVYRSLAFDARDLRVLTCAFGIVLALTFLVSAERRAAREHATQERARAIEGELGLRLRSEAGGEARVLGLRVTSASMFRIVYAAAVLVWGYALSRTLGE